MAVQWASAVGADSAKLCARGKARASVRYGKKGGKLDQSVAAECTPFSVGSGQLTQENWNATLVGLVASTAYEYQVVHPYFPSVFYVGILSHGEVGSLRCGRCSARLTQLYSRYSSYLYSTLLSSSRWSRASPPRPSSVSARRRMPHRSLRTSHTRCGFTPHRYTTKVEEIPSGGDTSA